MGGREAVHGREGSQAHVEKCSHIHDMTNKSNKRGLRSAELRYIGIKIIIERLMSILSPACFLGNTRNEKDSAR